MMSCKGELSGLISVLIAAASLLPILVNSACSAEDFGDKRSIAVAVNTTSPTWTSGVGELVARKCDNCHAKSPSQFVPGEIRSDPGRYQLGLAESEDAFLTHGAASYSRVFETTDKPMPPAYGTPLNADERAALKLYLEQKGYGGAAAVSQRTDFVAEACAGAAANTLTLAVDIAPVAAAQGCTLAGCHAVGSAGNGGVALTAAADWRTHRTDLIWVLAKDGTGANPMPPGRAQGYTAAGQPGEILLRYLCGSAEVTAAP